MIDWDGSTVGKDLAFSDWHSKRFQRETEEILLTLGAKICLSCRTPFRPRSSRSRFCSRRCVDRVQWGRTGKARDRKRTRCRLCLAPYGTCHCDPWACVRSLHSIR
jgi:hypothetical protein